MIIILLYILSILVANIVTGTFAPITIGMFIIPCGTLFIGASFILRDLVQNKYGKKKTYYYILIALIISCLFSITSGDIFYITVASGLAFIVSEIVDTEIYSRVKSAMHKRVIYSGIFGGILDSTIFVIIGLSPLTTGIIAWGLVIYAIVGQISVKIIMQFIGAGIIYKFNKQN